MKSPVNDRTADIVESRGIKHAHQFKGLSEIANQPLRVEVLYSPLRTANLESYQENLKFWTQIIEEYAEHHLIFSMEQLKSALLLNNKVPASLPQVIEHLLSTSQITLLPTFVDNVTPENKRWWNSLISSLGSFSYKAFGYLSGRKGWDDSSDFVHLPALKACVEKVGNIIPKEETLSTLEEFRKSVQSVTGLNTRDIDLLILHMKCTGKLDTCEVGSVSVVKTQSSRITNEEKAQFDIRTTKKKMETRLETTENEILGLHEKAREAVRSGMTERAKYHLKNRKRLQVKAKKYSDVLCNLSSIEDAIEEAGYSKTVLSTYETGKAALDKFLTDNKLTSDRVNQVMMDIADVIDDTNEISNELANLSISGESDDEEMRQLLLELEQLNESNVAITQEPTFPCVPNELPTGQGGRKSVSKSRAGDPNEKTAMTAS